VGNEAKAIVNIQATLHDDVTYEDFDS